MVQLGHKHSKEGLVFVSLCFDEPENEEAALEFLQDQNASYVNLLATAGEGGDVFQEFGVPSGIPLYRLYDRQGELRYQFSQFPDDLDHGEPIQNVDQRVKELLAE